MPALRRVRESGGRSAAGLLGAATAATVVMVMTATEDVPQHCRGGSSASGRVAGGACCGVGGALVAGWVMELAGVPMRFWNRRVVAGVLRCCRSGVGGAALEGRQPGQRWGAAAMLGLRWGRDADVLACTACSGPRWKIWEEGSSAGFTWPSGSSR